MFFSGLKLGFLKSYLPSETWSGGGADGAGGAFAIAAAMTASISAEDRGCDGEYDGLACIGTWAKDKGPRI